ncbi:MAG: RDD family protein [Leptolyngbyaceae cyanobacterium bins.59]|nr:RDD family protein [Leptolyngbyaceae cyanobacterium bins.59]
MNLSVWRRCIAFTLDVSFPGLVATLLSKGSLISASWIFLLTWLLWRVGFASQAHGQSPGRWIMDLRVSDTKFGRTPGWLTLLVREGIIAGNSLLVVWGGHAFFSRNDWQILVLTFLISLIDGAFLLSDPWRQHMLHDLIAHTTIIGTSKTYSFRLKLRQVRLKLLKLINYRLL